MEWLPRYQDPQIFPTILPYGSPKHFTLGPHLTARDLGRSWTFPLAKPFSLFRGTPYPTDTWTAPEEYSLRHRGQTEWFSSGS